MSSHISDDLPRLLSGEASRDDVLVAAAHLRECEDCRQELVSAVVAHASLTSARRFAPDVVKALGEATTEASAAQIPDLSAVFAQVRSEAAAAPPRARTHALALQRLRLSRAAVGAVAAGLIIGAGGLAIIEHTASSSPSGQSIALSAYGIGHSAAKAQLVGSDTMKIDATSLPKLGSAQRYEVWLTNGARTQMQPVGWIGSDGRSQLTIPKNLMQTYNAIEVSVQPLNSSTYTYSGVSVLRGTYRS